MFFCLNLSEWLFNMILLPSPDDTDRLGKLLAHCLTKFRPNIVLQGFNIRLEGNLGAGKTSLTRATLRALGVTGRIKSPTFTLLETYPIDSEIEVFHFDFYRFETPEEFLDAGFRDNFSPGHITFCEWSEKAGECLPPADLTIELEPYNDGRSVQISALSDLGVNVLSELKKQWPSPVEL